MLTSRLHMCAFFRVQSCAHAEMPAVNFLRLIRVCRMVKLVRKLTTLRILINALISSIIPVWVFINGTNTCVCVCVCIRTIFTSLELAPLT